MVIENNSNPDKMADSEKGEETMAVCRDIFGENVATRKIY